MEVRDPREGAERLTDLVRGRPWVVLSGAGLSTDSGIPDYRGPTAVRATPMQFSDFTGSAENRRRYWARSYLGWPRMADAQPNAGHHALARLGGCGLIGIITQNVDGLHTAAGSEDVIDLHGTLSRVVCLDCGQRSDRAALQRLLATLNPGVIGDVLPGRAELRPDGDAVADQWRTFRVPACQVCGGRLKPDVVFFGEPVPKDRVAAAYALVEQAEVLVVVGSSLTVMSGLRFVRYQAKRGRPVAVVNRGTTRGDDLVTLRIDAGCSQTLSVVEATLTEVAARG